LGIIGVDDPPGITPKKLKEVLKCASFFSLLEVVFFKSHQASYPIPQ
jgi:hypothetical protein